MSCRFLSTGVRTVALCLRRLFLFLPWMRCAVSAARGGQSAFTRAHACLAWLVLQRGGVCLVRAIVEAVVAVEVNTVTGVIADPVTKPQEETHVFC